MHSYSARAATAGRRCSRGVLLAAGRGHVGAPVRPDGGYRWFMPGVWAGGGGGRQTMHSWPATRPRRRRQARHSMASNQLWAVPGAAAGSDASELTKKNRGVILETAGIFWVRNEDMWHNINGMQWSGDSWSWEWITRCISSKVRSRNFADSPLVERSQNDQAFFNHWSK